MSKNKYMVPLLSIFVIGLATGCSSKSSTVAPVVNVIEHKVIMQEREEKKVFDPMMKDNTPTQKAVVDMGVVLKTHVVAYKDNNHNLMAGHDVFFFAVQPDFVTTNGLPKEKNKYTYKGPLVNLSKTDVINTDKVVEDESTKFERDADFDKRIEHFLQEEEKHLIEKK